MTATPAATIIFRHHRNTENLGDRLCSPDQHVPELAARGRAVDLSQPTPPCSTVIYGGGKIMGGLARTFGANDLAARHRIAWGVSTVHKAPFSLKYWQAFRRMDLIGSRDFNDRRFVFAPCVTCLSPGFDQSHPETRDVVVYAHAWKSGQQGLRVPDHVPVMTNAAKDFAQVLAFLGSARTVVSNSYHGVYWALLLGKRVLCLPFSGKFSGYRLPPGYARAEDWQDKLHKAQAQPEMLPLCREATAAFRERVGNLIAG